MDPAELELLDPVPRLRLPDELEEDDPLVTETNPEPPAELVSNAFPPGPLTIATEPPEPKSDSPAPTTKDPPSELDPPLKVKIPPFE